MGRYDSSFPFAAIEGQEDAKTALLIAAVNPLVGGVLLAGEKGTAKSTLVRGLSALMPNAPFVELPLNITEDRLVGSINIEHAVTEGKATLERGLFALADGGFLYVDEVNLLPEHVANVVIQTAGVGENVIEREGVSFRHDSRFVLIGSMNPEEGALRSQLLDRFGLYVRVKGETDVGMRCSITRKRLEYEKDPAAFRKQWETQTKALSAQVMSARDMLTEVTVPEKQLRFAATLAKEGQCAGHRAELALCETGKALAALEKRDQVTERDIRMAAKFVLPHRLREAVTPERPEQATEPPEDAGDREAEQIDMQPLPPNDRTFTENRESCVEEQNEWQDIEPIDAELVLQIREATADEPKGSGKRLKVKTHTKTGRYIRYRLPVSAPADIALDATLRAAVMHPCEIPGLKVEIRKDDIREKVRERRTGATILFLVDASGSMGAHRRMGAVKGAVLSLLNDAYQKRDTVGIVAFRNDKAEAVLNFTRSVDLAEKCLRDLRTGGKTPLAAGLMKAYELLKTERIKNADALQYLVLVSDCRANVALTGKDALLDAQNLARKLQAEGVKSLVLDTEKGYLRLGLAKKLSDALNGQYLQLRRITSDEIAGSVRAIL